MANIHFFFFFWSIDSRFQRPNLKCWFCTLKSYYSEQPFSKPPLGKGLPFYSHTQKPRQYVLMKSQPFLYDDNKNLCPITWCRWVIIIWLQSRRLYTFFYKHCDTWGTRCLLSSRLPHHDNILQFPPTAFPESNYLIYYPSTYTNSTLLSAWSQPRIPAHLTIFC